MSGDLTARQVQTAEDHIAFEGAVELLSWQDTSNWGFKIRLGLSHRGELDYFDGVMTMRKSRGGQRYHCILMEDGEILHQFEAQFCGRGWSEGKGAHIALHIGELDTITFFRNEVTGDQGETETPGTLYEIMMMELGDDEMIVNQAKRARAAGVVDPQPKGGPRSKAVGMMLNDFDFIHWLSYRSLWAVCDGDGVRIEYNPATADELVKRTLKISSKKELDHGNAELSSDDVWMRWETQFHRPFLHYLQRRHGK